MSEDVEALRRRLERAEAIVEALQGQEVDAVVGKHGVAVLRLLEVERKLSQSEERLRMALEGGEVGLWDLDLLSGNVFWSETLHDLLGRNRDEAVDGDTFFEYIHEEDRPRVRQRVARWHAEGGDFREEFRIVRDDGQVRWLAASGEVERDQDGRAVRACGVNYDITERKQAETAHREREERLRLAATIGKIGTWDLDIESGDLDLSARAREIYGLPAQGEVTVQDVLARVHEDDRADVESAVDAVCRTRADIENEYRVAMPDGSERWVQIRCQTAFDAQGQPLRNLGVVIETTYRKRYEEHLEDLNLELERRVTERTAQVQKQAEQLRALASKLNRAEQRERKRLAQILHDHIQQLLAAARMQVGWIKGYDDQQRMRTTAEEVYAILREAIDACRSLVTDLSPPVLHEVGLGAALDWLAARMLEKHHLEVQVRSDTVAEPASEEVRVLLFECVRELLFNVVKHAGVADAQVALLRARDHQIRIVVRDEGAGFDPDMLTERRSDAASFGLYSIQERLAHLGGRMTVASAPGEGSRVTLTAPLGEQGQPGAENARATPPTSRAPTVTLRRKTKLCRVLIVDDHKIMREGLVGLFELESDIEVVGQAADGPEAVKLVGQLEPDVVIMDVNLGATSGVDATREILSGGSRAKIIGLSMHADGGVARAMREAGATAYLTKDGPSEDLIAAVRACRQA